MEIRAINLAKQSVGKRKIEHEKMPADRKDTRHFPQGRAPIDHVAQTKCDRDHIEALIWKRELKCIRDHGLLDAFGASDGQHLGGEISADDFGLWKLSCDC